MKCSPLPLEGVTPLRRAVLGHYDRARRSLPWRGEADPYRILVSEVMLQQTRVDTVLDYYGRWLERFPDVQSLATAPEGDVLKAWEGLGYYRRARNLHRTAKVVRERPNGALPTCYDELVELPGVGEYTAGAVASIAFGEVVPAVDGNVRRVLSRLFDVAEPGQAWLRRTAAALVEPARPGDWNQAMMELGATVCVRRSPRCDACPLAPWCMARAARTVADRPATVVRAEPRKALIALAVLHRDGEVLVVRRPASGLLGGMWALPEREVSDAGEAASATLQIAKELGATVEGEPDALPEHGHKFTHLHASYLPTMMPVGEVRAAGAASAWVDPAVRTELALPVAQRRVLNSALERLRVTTARATEAATEPSRVST
jgi:A/G-specific adenine glycosylase